MENRNGLLVQTFLTEANGRAARDAAMLMAEAIPGGKRVTLGGDKNYESAGINRHEGETARVLRERSSDPLGPEFCTAHRGVRCEA